MQLAICCRRCVCILEITFWRMRVLAKVYSCAVVGLEGVPVEVEVDISQGLPSFQIVGLPDAAVQESKERVRPAVRNSGFTFPMKRLTANLAPADIRKAGPSYDLPIAVGLLLASEQISGQVERALFVGELGLDGPCATPMACCQW